MGLVWALCVLMAKGGRNGVSILLITSVIGLDEKIVNAVRAKVYEGCMLGEGWVKRPIEK